MRYKKGAMISDSPNVLHDGKLHINCKDKELLRLAGWSEYTPPKKSWWRRIWEELKAGVMQ